MEFTNVVMILKEAQAHKIKIDAIQKSYRGECDFEIALKQAGDIAHWLQENNHTINNRLTNEVLNMTLQSKRYFPLIFIGEIIDANPTIFSDDMWELFSTSGILSKEFVSKWQGKLEVYSLSQNKLINESHFAEVTRPIDLKLMVNKSVLSYNHVLRNIGFTLQKNKLDEAELVDLISTFTHFNAVELNELVKYAKSVYRYNF